jgi:hypothetical protein
MKKQIVFFLILILGFVYAKAQDQEVTPVDMRGWIDESNPRKIRVDSYTHALLTIGYEHHEIHEGSMFTCNYTNTTTNTGEMSIIAFKTQDSDVECHLLINGSSTAGSYVVMYQDSDLDTTEGADLTIYNHNLNSTKTSTVSNLDGTPELGEATSFTESQAAGATLSTASPVWIYYLGAAASGADIPGYHRGDNEFILKADTEYAVVIVATSNDDNIHNIVLTWYETTPKD